MRSRRPLSTALAAFVGLVGSFASLYAAEFRVGPGGAYATLREAAGIAAATPGEHTIKVRAGTYADGVFDLVAVGPDADIKIVGGWDATFASRTMDAAATVFDGGFVEQILRFEVHGGSLTLEGLTLRNGRRGLRIDVRAAGSLRVANCVAHGNVLAAVDDSYRGVGAYLWLSGGSRAEVVDSVFSSNTAADAPFVTHGVGLSVLSQGASQVTILRNRFEGNRSRAPWTQGAGLEVQMLGTGARVEIAENEFVDNQTESTFASDDIFDSSALALDVVSVDAGALVEARRNRFRGNLGAPQLRLFNAPGSQLTVSDSLVAGGSGSPTAITCHLCGSETALTNLTISDSGGIRIGPYPSAAVAISNTIVVGSGAAIFADPGVPAPTLSANLVGVDPHFINPAAGDYRLRPGSPGIDAGDDTPPGGLGLSDLAGETRVSGASVDIGAFEFSLGALGRSGACVVGSRVFPMGGHTNACTCVRDEGLRNHRCGFFLPEIFLDAVIPIPLDPNDPTDPQWVILPWQGADGAYDLFFEVWRDGKWVTVAGSGPQTGMLKLNDLTVEKFMLPGGERDLPLRARLQHFAPGPQGPVTVEDVVYLLVGK